MMRVRITVGVVGLVVAASLAGAQSTAAGTGAGEVISNGSLVHTLLAAPVTGQPYSAIQVHETRQKLADGTTISHKGHHFVARDSAGRVRVEVRMAKGENGEPDTVLVFVSDPGAHTITTWMMGSKGPKTASVVKISDQQKQAAGPVATKPESTRPQPVVTTEDLGMQTVQGLPVSDVKTTTVVPVGRAGNDAPITKTREVWTSQDLKLVMKERWEDPRSGERTIELDKFSRAEPDAALFRVPQGYTVKSVLETMKELETKLEAAQN
jgi:tartrate dehydratase beta subunit/fumarate hydratase class I family protein